MRILLDECIDEALRHCFAGHSCETCRYAGLRGLSNGNLLAAAEQAGFDVLITVDRNIAHRQNFLNRRIAVLILEPRTTTFNDLIVLMPDVARALQAIKPGGAIRI